MGTQLSKIQQSLFHELKKVGVLYILFVIALGVLIGLNLHLKY